MQKHSHWWLPVLFALVAAACKRTGIGQRIRVVDSGHRGVGSNRAERAWRTRRASRVKRASRIERARRVD